MEAWAELTPGSFGPIEGGDYVADEAARKLTGRVGADVVGLDCVQLGVGSVGRFCSGGSSLISVYVY